MVEHEEEKPSKSAIFLPGYNMKTLRHKKTCQKMIDIKENLRKYRKTCRKRVHLKKYEKGLNITIGKASTTTESEKSSSSSRGKSLKSPIDVPSLPDLIGMSEDAESKSSRTEVSSIDMNLITAEEDEERDDVEEEEEEENSSLNQSFSGIYLGRKENGMTTWKKNLEKNKFSRLEKSVVPLLMERMKNLSDENAELKKRMRQLKQHIDEHNLNFVSAMDEITIVRGENQLLQQEYEIAQRSLEAMGKEMKVKEKEIVDLKLEIPKCCACLEATPQIAYKCGHVPLCAPCHAKWEEKKSKCPMCRATSDGVLAVRL